MKFLKYFLLFLIPFIGVAFVIVAYFKLNDKISTIKAPTLPSITLNDVIKFSRFSLEKAPSQSLVGNITSLDGDVMYESRNATESAKIDKPQEIQQGEKLETGTNGHIVLTFKDATDITVGPGSVLGVIQTLPNDLVFSQTKGTIEYKKLSDKPITIRATHLLIELSGEAKVSLDPEKPIVMVVAVNGPVSIAYNNINNDTRLINLEEGKTLTFNDATRRSIVK